jgi:hypothetical protein
MKLKLRSASHITPWWALVLMIWSISWPSPPKTIWNIIKLYVPWCISAHLWIFAHICLIRQLSQDCIIIIKRHDSQKLEPTIWLWNYTSHTKVSFIEFVANALRDNMSMIIFDLWGCGSCERPKTSYLDAHFGNSTFGSSHSTSSAYQRFNKKWDQLWLSASIQSPYLEF